jgi:general stress protein YciG
MTNNHNGSRAGSARGRGFAGMDPARQRDIAREGGRAAHEKGTAHEFTSSEARAAGLKSRMGRGLRDNDR